MWQLTAEVLMGTVIEHLFNPQCTCAARVTVVGLCVFVCVCLSMVILALQVTGWLCEQYKRLQNNTILKIKTVIFQKQLRSGDMARK